MLRYGLVGLAANGIGYAIYLIITAFGWEPKLAMSLLYLLGAGIGFLGNRVWTFRDHGRVWPALWRYGAVHGIGYGTNFMLLYILVDRLGYPHQIVQAAAILIVALVLFLCFNLFVFRAPKDETHT
ncbi:GtrA family protein [Aurantimonas marina]|uniref:GtrA family protein n=1 Tax=Aurantimonas marina TaxID=2780508 RepID=UPI0019D12E2D|nr:GtrA family protein [Aurantimonas marina]